MLSTFTESASLLDDRNAAGCPWRRLADSVLAGEPASRDDGLRILRSTDVELPSLLAAAFLIRERHFGREVQFYSLQNAKSGLCPEDCGYCSQSKVSEAPIDKYVFQSEEKLLEAARRAKANQARTYCIVASGRGPSDREVQHVARAVRRIKQELGLHICVCLGLLSPDQARLLHEAGVDRVNHNLNTSARFYPEICSTHTYADRLETLRAVREAGMELCSGCIVGMGETHDDLVDVALALRELKAESIPVNFLHPIDGTPLAHRLPDAAAPRGPAPLTPRDCLRALCLFRFMNPQSEIRMAGGREFHLRSLQPWGLLPANSLFVSDYLTTKGQAAELDVQMVEDLGFTVSRRGAL